MKRAALLGLGLGLALATLGAAGCHDPVTEVVVVMRSDLSVPGDTDQILISATPGTIVGPPNNPGQAFQASLLAFPVSMGFVSQGAGTGAFSMTVQLTRLSSNFQTQIVISRNITGIRFVPHETRMLVLSLPKACACSGTSCPNPGINPDCDDLVDPITEPFDPAVAPPSGMFQPNGQIRPTPVDAGRGIVDPGFTSDGGMGVPDRSIPDGAANDGGSPDGTMTDGARIDGGAGDGGSMDGGRMDGGATDGGATDGGATDAGSTDGGQTDAGGADGGRAVDAEIG